jgi:hypothetical protein
MEYWHIYIANIRMIRRSVNRTVALILLGRVVTVTSKNSKGGEELVRIILRSSALYENNLAVPPPPAFSSLGNLLLGINSIVPYQRFKHDLV